MTYNILRSSYFDDQIAPDLRNMVFNNTSASKKLRELEQATLLFGLQFLILHHQGATLETFNFFFFV